MPRRRGPVIAEYAERLEAAPPAAALLDKGTTSTPRRPAEVAAVLDRVLLILAGVLLLAALLLERPTPMAIAPREVQSATSAEPAPTWN